MLIISEEEKLALLGYQDAGHSLSWYKERFPDLLNDLERYIIDAVKMNGIFPKEAKNAAEPIRYHKYYLILEPTKNNQYVVKLSNTDRMEIQKEYYFDDVNKAAMCLIRNSFTTAGSIKEYWDCGKE